MSKKVPIRGLVAKVLNSRELALNIGEEQNVRTGMFFDVMDISGENIIDPESDEILGSIERPKVRVQITKVLPKLSVASTFKKSKVNIGGAGVSMSALNRAFMPPKWVTKYETLKTEENTWEDLDESESYVKSGDPVVQVTEKLQDDETID